ncbi:MAG: OadG family protein [Deltaproteobacteria bacterium]|nr:OadG family protein [Deltaproteobacteria bacterium]MBW2072115.1 OadG family protein [Deltaproteobacteria bacterium]
MGGFSAINSANGWSVAALGISIVFTGLATLTLVIYLLPYLLKWCSARAGAPLSDRLKKTVIRVKEAKAVADLSLAEQSIDAESLRNAEAALRLITSRLGEPFKLPQLLDIAEKRGLARPYATVNRLILNRRILAGADGLFRWSSSSEKAKATTETTPPGQPV